MSFTLAETIAAQIWMNQANIVLERIARSEQRNRSGTYSDYNADRGLHIVRLDNGGVLRSRLITNAGLAAGDRVAVSRGRSINWIKSQPR